MTDNSSPPTRQLRRTLEREAAALDSDTTRALRLAREKALEGADRGPQQWPVWLGSAAASVVVFSAVFLLRDGNVPDAPGIDTAAVMADLEVLAQEDDLGLIEDLEFLDWLSGVDEEIT